MSCSKFSFYEAYCPGGQTGMGLINFRRAMRAIKNSGYEVIDHFAEVSKIVETSATSKPIIGYRLSRYACYLIVQNGDPRKEVIALCQTLGMVKLNLLPLPTSLSAQILPPCFSINSLQRIKPSPVPCSFCVPFVE